MCLSYPMVIAMAAHCFFYATSNEVRRFCRKTVETILELNEGSIAYAQYFQDDIGVTEASHQLHVILDSKSTTDDCSLYVLRNFETITSGQASLAFRRHALFKSLLILQRQCVAQLDPGLNQEMTYDDRISAFTSPNFLVQYVRYFSCTEITPVSLSNARYIETPQNTRKQL